jgi:hypothetical protein
MGLVVANTTATTKTTMTRAKPDRARSPWPASRWLDVAAVVALSVVAFLTRRGGLPHDGLWFDDSWVAAGALHGSLRHLMMVGSGHPLFTAGLMAWSTITDDNLRSLAYPVLVAGIAGPALLYVALRSFGYPQSICGLLGAALVVSDVDMLYSGRVKPYTFDTLLVLGLVVVVPRLARITWRWPMAVGWVVAAMLFATFTGNMLVVMAAAGAILFLHPASDRIVRGAAVTAQAVGFLGLLWLAQRSSDLAGIEAFNGHFYDAHLDFFINPIRFAGEVLQHLRRVAMVYPGGSGAWLTLFALAAVAGLVVAAVRTWTRSESLRARLLLLILAFAFFGALLHKFPFGAAKVHFLSNGGRFTLWLTPVMAVGLAAVLHRLRRKIPRAALRIGFDTLALAAAVLVVVVGYRSATPYPFPGSASATEYVESKLRPDDVVLITETSIYAYAAASSTPLSLRATPTREIGFTPHFANPNIHTIGALGEAAGEPAQISRFVAGAERVFVHASVPAFTDLTTVENALRDAGYRETRHRLFDAALVVTWQR